MKKEEGGDQVEMKEQGEEAQHMRSKGASDSLIANNYIVLLGVRGAIS